MLLVSLEGRYTFLEENLTIKKPQYQRRNFLFQLDLSCSLTEANQLQNNEQHQNISLNKRIAPFAVLQRPFLFKFPISVFAQETSDYFSIAPSALPPSFGFIHFSHHLDPNRDDSLLYKKYKKEKNELADTSFSISYSVNARLIVKDAYSLQNCIINHQEIYRKFVGTPTPPLLENNTNHPNMQLDMLLKLAENDIRKGVNLNKEMINRPRDSEKQLLELITTSCSSSSSSNLRISINPTETVFLKSTSFFLHPSTRFFKKRESKDGVMNRQYNQISSEISTSGVAQPFKCLMNGDLSSVQFILKINHHIPDLKGGKGIIKKVDNSNFKVNLSIVHLSSKGGNIPIELNPSWFSDRDSITKNLGRPIKDLLLLNRQISQNNEKPPSRLIDAMRALGTISITHKNQFGNALIVEIVEVSRDYENTLSNYVQEVSVSVKIDPLFSSKFSIVPSFQTLKWARIYFLQVIVDVTKILPESLLRNYSCVNSHIILEIPVKVE